MGGTLQILAPCPQRAIGFEIAWIKTKLFLRDVFNFHDDFFY
jgi:hypothetical protein